MEPDLLRYDDHRGFGHKKTNFFAWTVGILLLSGVAIAAWLGSFYIVGQPERPESYRILQKLHKIDPPKRFALTAAPAGEFLNSQQLYQRYRSMGPAELARKDAELARNFIRNFQQVHGLEPDVRGIFAKLIERDFLVAPARDGLLDIALASDGFIGLRPTRRRKSGHGGPRKSSFQNMATRKIGHVLKCRGP